MSETDAMPVTVDAFLGGRVMIEQPARGYRAGLDAVLLAASVAAGDGERVLDVGAGVGTVGLCLATRCAAVRVTLLEREPALAAIAGGNVARNGLTDRVTVVAAGIGASADDLAAMGLETESFDQVVANPPYHASGRGTQAPDPLKAASHAMAEEALDTWLRVMTRLTRPGGRLTLIHKTEALADVLTALRGRCGAVRVLPVHPRSDAPANRILVRAIKGSRGPLVLLPGLVLAGADGAVRPEVDGILRRGDALPLGP